MRKRPLRNSDRRTRRIPPEASRLRPGNRPRRVDLSVAVGPLRLKNPILVASGTFGGRYADVIDTSSIGAVVLKTVTPAPRPGNRPPRIVETPSGILNSIGLENKGIAKFVEDELADARERYRTVIIASVSAASVDEYSLLARRIEASGAADGIELNISCPNVSEGLDFGTDPVLTGEVVAAVRRVTRLPLIAKLTPNVTDIIRIARAAEENGADAVSLVNTLKGMAVDWRHRRPMLGAITGGLSGPAIKPVALRMVWEAAGAVGIPVIGIGGIASADDAMEFLCAGAAAVQIGTANFTDPQTPVRAVRELPRLLREAGASSVSGFVRSIQVESDGRRH